MTIRSEERAMDGPEGSIFLPKTASEIDRYQTALLLGRGVGEGKTPDELFALRAAANEALKALRMKVSPDIAAVAIAPEI